MREVDKKALPSVEILKECFSYEEDSGKLTWKSRPVGHFQSEHAFKIFESRNVGKPVGWKSTNGYIMCRVFGVQYYTHRLIWKLTEGDEPVEIDHINGVRDDNRKINLRDVSRNSNAKNKQIPINNTSGVKGVSYHTRDDVWSAYITYNGSRISLGSFKSKDLAIEARSLKEVELYGEYKRGE